MSRTLLFGVSQSGRVIRRFLHDGMNVDEAGAVAYDAVLPVIAGGRLGRFNDRFAVPGTLPSEPDQLTDDVGYGALLARAGAPVKVMAMNSSNEYWRGDGALLHADGHPDVRVHLVAGTQHGTGYLPQLFEMPALGWKGRNGFNTIDYRPVLRALLQQVVDWVDDGVEPAPSTEPSADQLSTREAVLARFAAAGRPTPRLASFAQPAGPVPRWTPPATRPPASACRRWPHRSACTPAGTCAIRTWVRRRTSCSWSDRAGGSTRCRRSASTWPAPPRSSRSSSDSGSCWRWTSRASSRPGRAGLAGGGGEPDTRPR